MTASASTRWRRDSPDASPRAVRSDPLSPWIVTQRIDDPDPHRANRQALEDIEQGATGLALVFEGAPNAFGYGLPAKPEALAIALHNVPFNRVHIRLDVHPASRASVDWLVVLLGKRRADPAKLSVSFGIDPAAAFAGNGRLRMSIEALRASMPQSLAHFFALGLPGILLEGDGRVFHNAGATEAQELGIALASAVSHLRMFEEARQALVYAAPHIGFSIAVDQDQFLSIAKLQGAAAAVGARAGDLLDPAGARRHPCRDVLPHDDGDGPRDQHPAHDDRLLRGGCRRRRHGGDPAAQHCARPARRLRAPHRPQHAAHPGEGKPYRFRGRSDRRFGQRRSADRVRSAKRHGTSSG